MTKQKKKKILFPPTPVCPSVRQGLSATFPSLRNRSFWHPRLHNALQRESTAWNSNNVLLNRQKESDVVNAQQSWKKRNKCRHRCHYHHWSKCISLLRCSTLKRIYCVLFLKGRGRESFPYFDLFGYLLVRRMLVRLSTFFQKVKRTVTWASVCVSVCVCLCKSDRDLDDDLGLQANVVCVPDVNI